MAQVKDFPSMKESVLELIRADIVNRVLAPGEVIRDVELAARYGVSTSPVREALVQLAAERLVDMPPNRPKRVSPLDLKTARDFYAVWKLVALAGFAWGAPKIMPEHIRRMTAALEALVAAFPDGDRYRLSRLAHDFFLPVYEASENVELIHTITRRLNWIDRLVVLNSAYETEAIFSRLKDIINYLMRGEFSEAIWVHYELVHEMEQDLLDWTDI